MTKHNQPKLLHTSWVAELAHAAKHTQPSAESRMRTNVSCEIRAGKQAIYVPPDMSQLQPRSLRYLHAFARTHNLQLIEDRRRVTVTPIREQRNKAQPSFGSALGELLQQLGMPGEPKPQSWPHRLASDSQHVSLNQLIKMAAFAAPKAKRSTLTPNAALQEITNDNSCDINVSGCKLVSEEISTLLSIFESKGFRALGHSTGKQYVMHVFLAGGTLSAPQIWSDFNTLTSTSFQLQILEAQNPAQDMGLFHATFYFDLAAAPSPWWLNTWEENQMASDSLRQVSTLKRAG